MGNTFPSQQTYKICLQCDKKGLHNNNIEILNVNYARHRNISDTDNILLRCNEGHIFYYNVLSISRKHTQLVLNYYSKKNTKDNLIKKNKKLIEQNKKLKKILLDNSIDIKDIDDIDNINETESNASVLK